MSDDTEAGLHEQPLEFDMTTGIGSDWSSLENTLFDFSPERSWSPWDESGQQIVFGSPETDAGYWQQQGTDFTCALVAQRSILESFGIEKSEAQLVYDATVNGWLTENGTSIEGMGNMLAHYDIPYHTSYGGTLETLMGELGRGNKVMVAVDGGELWGSDDPSEDEALGERADHAVQVTGVKYGSDGAATIVLNDSGNPEGRAIEYDWDTFADAWADSGNFYLATDVAPEVSGGADALACEIRLGGEMVSANATAKYWWEESGGGIDIALHCDLPSMSSVMRNVLAQLI